MPAHPPVDPPTSLGAGGIPLASPIVDAASLAADLRSARPPVVWDVRWSLVSNGYDVFLAGRIPGAHFVDLDSDLAAPPGIGGRHPLPDPAVLAALMARTGVVDGTPVVVCGARDTSIAARAWWLLRWIGHRDVRVLDGGFEAWARAGLEAETGPEQPIAGEPGPAAEEPEPALSAGREAAGSPSVGSFVGAMPTVDADGAAALGAGSGTALLDARAVERYRGEVEPVDPVPGHIPGAVNVPLMTVHAPDGTLLPPAGLRAAFAAAGVRAGVVAAASCGSGVTACSLILAGEIVGLDLALYPGSYSGWCALHRPVERG